MTKTFALFSLLATSILGGCSSTTQVTDTAQYCYTTENINVTDGTTVNSQTKVECSDKPRVEHFVKKQGIADECREYKQLVSINGREKIIKGFLCKFPDGSWQAVDGRYAYFN